MFVNVTCENNIFEDVTFLCKHILFILIYSLKEKQPNQFQKDNKRKKIIIE